MHLITFHNWTNYPKCTSICPNPEFTEVIQEKCQHFERNFVYRKDSYMFLLVTFCDYLYLILLKTHFIDFSCASHPVSLSTAFLCLHMWAEPTPSCCSAAPFWKNPSLSWSEHPCLSLSLYHFAPVSLQWGREGASEGSLFLCHSPA